MKKLLSILLLLATLFPLSAIVFADDSIECVHSNSIDTVTQKLSEARKEMAAAGEGYSSASPRAVNTAGAIPEYRENPEYTYDDEGKILTFTDDDGLIWEYQYTGAGNYKYRIATIENPGWSFGDTRKFSNGFTAAPVVFDKEYENCVGFDVICEITSSSGVGPRGCVAIYVDEPVVSESMYQLEAFFYCREGENSEHTVTFSEPFHVRGVCVRPMNTALNCYTSTVGVRNLRLLDYTY